VRGGGGLVIILYYGDWSLSRLVFDVGVGVASDRSGRRPQLHCQIGGIR